MGNKVSENIGKEISAKVTKVEANGLYFQLESGDQAFLPKGNMHVGKKKKLTEIFSEGFVVNAKIKNIKKDKVILTQKEEKVDSTPKTVEATKAKHNKKKPKKLNQDSAKKDKESKINEQPKQPKQEENVQEEAKQKTLKDLKQSIVAQAGDSFSNIDLNFDANKAIQDGGNILSSIWQAILDFFKSFGA